jgi:predicted metal-dependent phosphotriesterase family hydrolase
MKRAATTSAPSPAAAAGRVEAARFSCASGRDRHRGGNIGTRACRRRARAARGTGAAGIDTIVDLTTYDVGRDIRFLEEVSRKSGPAYDRRHGPERRAQNIKRLVDAGFVGKVFLSQDAKFGGSLLGEDAKDFRSKLDPQEGLLFTARTLIPRLRQIGVPDAGIRTMTVGNSRAFFAVP